ncbi:MAG: hypothetical protein JJU03_05825 [Idiomarina sp.]|nr:hypothetical protein [Idiomarina sp.]
MKKTCLFFALAAALSLSACSDPDDQRGDPTEPTQQAPATEREARQQALHEDENVSEEGSSDGIDPARAPERQPASATNGYRDLYASNIEELGDIDDPRTVRTHTQEHVELQQELRELLQRTEADERGQCAMIPYGHKPCGGPESYMVYSQKDMSDDDIDELHEKVRRYNQLDAFIKSAQQMMSTCEVTPQPEIQFENGRCIAGNAR